MAEESKRSLSFDTLAITGGRRHGRSGTAMNVPLVMASNYRHGAEEIYSREDGTPTWLAFEEALGALEGGRAIAFSSGMGAVGAVLGSMRAGARILAPLDAYAGALASLREGLESGLWNVEFLDMTATGTVLEALEKGADLLWLESPSNPLLEISDLPSLCGAARRLGILSVVDNTFATPMLQRPLELGADFALHSVTKFIGGHSDLLLGAVVTRSEELWEGLRHRRILGGATPGGLEAFLALRGLRTLPLRLRRAQANAQLLARRLADHPRVSEVRYPGLGSSGESSEVSWMSGTGALISFELTGDVEETDAFCDALELVEHATSLGGVETSLERRSRYAGQDHLPPTLIRMSVGCEDPEDLWKDLEQALAEL